MPLTPEQQALQEAAQRMLGCRSVMEAWDMEAQYRSRANPAAILELFSDLAQCNEDYGQAVDSVAQLQEEVFEVRAQLEAQEAPDLRQTQAETPRPAMSTCATIADYKAAMAKHEVEAALQFLADQAQELGMGYGEAPEPGAALHGEPSWRTADISWACAALKEHTIFDADALQREWNAMKAIALAAEAALSQPVQAVPDILLDGMAVYEEVQRKAGHMRTSPENVSDVLDAAVRLIRAAPGDPAQ